MTNQPKFFFSFFFSLFLITALFVNAQQFRTPRPSPSATLTQTVGVTDITIDYSSPGVKERKIWGDLVPYDKVWRTGANEVTSITFSDLVKINGNNLKIIVLIKINHFISLTKQNSFQRTSIIFSASSSAFIEILLTFVLCVEDWYFSRWSFVVNK